MPAAQHGDLILNNQSESGETIPDSLGGDGDVRLRDDVRLLGGLLGETLISQEGRELYDLVERIRGVTKTARADGGRAADTLSGLLSVLPPDRIFSLARAFSHFLGLANIAEQHHQNRQIHEANTREIHDTVARLLSNGLDAAAIGALAHRMEIGLVITAHPTEIRRRTLTQKYHRIANLLSQSDNLDPTANERARLVQSLRREVVAIWETDEIRRERPTPLDEARSGLVVMEQSVWIVLPEVLRELDEALTTHCGQSLSLDAAPIRFGSWIGGDRDGNPNVTPDITRRACLMARSMAAGLYWQEVDELRRELSMVRANNTVNQLARNAHEPYRVLLRQLQDRLAETRRWVDARLDNRRTEDGGIIESIDEIEQTLRTCYRSLHECGAGIVADGRLLDLIRRCRCFGLSLVALDIRQEASRHAEALDAITTYLGLGSYQSWDEARRLEFLTTELRGRRPLIPDSFDGPEPVNEVLATFRVLGEIPRECLGSYVISMASQASDVLAVELLQRECGVASPLPVVPLLERVEHLANGGTVLERLFDIDWYRERSSMRQEIMIGYSDSAKDAGQLAAAWGLYRAQEELTEVARRLGVELKLFHGRGGTVARGGIPARDAIRSLPPGSVDGRLRVTEQGEVVQAKYGLPATAEETLTTYLTSVLETSLCPPPQPKPNWRRAMDAMSEVAMGAYRELVQQNPRFLDYFHAATPESELAKLNIGSRPARRKPGRDIAHLRAIPWIFAWTQTRLMLPAWLGVGYGLKAVAGEDISRLHEMESEWPFFAATLDAIEMVLAKTDPNVAAQYDQRLVPEDLRHFGQELRDRFSRVYDVVLKVTRHRSPLEHEPVTRKSINLRNPYTDPLNLLQVELLDRIRRGDDGMVQDALLITVNGIAAGMRNTG